MHRYLSPMLTRPSLSHTSLSEMSSFAQDKSVGRTAARRRTVLMMSYMCVSNRTARLLVTLCLILLLRCACSALSESNMEFSVSAANNASAEIADSINYPYLRMFSVADNPSLIPLDGEQSTDLAFNC